MFLIMEAAFDVKALPLAQGEYPKGEGV